jgi:hypothetical protein
MKEKQRLRRDDDLQRSKVVTRIHRPTMKVMV